MVSEMGGRDCWELGVVLNRNFVGSEISKDYCDVIDRRLQPIVEINKQIE
jgi:DNA modification methylase